MSTPEPAATPAPKSAATTYRILKFPPKPQGNTASSGMLPHTGLKDLGTVKAANASAAIRAIGEKEGEGTYVAVPENSWKPATVTVEQTTRIRLT